MNRISIPKVLVGSGVAFLGGLGFDNLFMNNPEILRISYHALMGVLVVFFRGDDQPYLLPGIAAPFAFMCRKKFLGQGSPNLFWGMFFAAKLAADEIKYRKQRRSLQKNSEKPVARDGPWTMCTIACVHQFVSWYFLPRATRVLDLGVKVLNKRKSRWLAAIGAFVGTSLWCSSGYWKTWIIMSNPILYAIVFVYHLHESPLRFAYLIKTYIRNRFDRALFHVSFGMAKSYQYRPLKYLPRERHKLEIRLLKLHAANSLGVLKASLIHVPICDTPPFEAISYRWASANEVPLLLDKQIFVITREVHKLLRALRYKKRDRLLWIDSICMNQKDAEEKSWQIGFMKDIYKSADQVIGWIAIIPEIPCLPGPFSSLGELRALSDEPDELATKMLRGELCAKMRGAVICLTNEFFFRTWIIQEVTLARKLVLKFYGIETSWEKFIESLLSFMEFHETSATTAYLGEVVHELALQSMIKIMNMELLRSKLKTNPDGLPLSQLLIESVDFHVTDPRDRVFGVLGLSTSDAREAIKVRYCSDTTELTVTINATRYILIAESSFRLLEMGGIGYSPSSHSEMLGWPSWIPRWNSPFIRSLQVLTSTRRPFYHTATWAPVEILGRDYTDPVLRIHSIFVDNIKVLSRPWSAIDQLFGLIDRSIDDQCRLYAMLRLLIDEAFFLVQHARHPIYTDVDKSNARLAHYNYATTVNKEKTDLIFSPSQRMQHQSTLLLKIALSCSKAYWTAGSMQWLTSMQMSRGASERMVWDYETYFQCKRRASVLPRKAMRFGHS